MLLSPPEAKIKGCSKSRADEPLLLSIDDKHSQEESRFKVMGYTDENRQLFIVFMKRDNLVRVISARDMNKKEETIYEKFKNDTKI